MTKDLAVRLGARSYAIKFGKGIITDLGSSCRELDLGRKVAIISNPTVLELLGRKAEDSLSAAGFQVHVVEIPDGETYKNGDTLNLIYDALIEAGLDRQSFLVALGGGVVGDISGYAASTYLRGISFVQVPTTLLAQVDSSVGGKTGINHRLGKNLIGTFHQPRLVVIDSETLATLPIREYRSGLAEVAKYGVVCDGEFFRQLVSEGDRLKGREPGMILDTVRSCCAIKAAVVERDEREGGYRAVLNYGHTFAHAVEKLTGYSRYLHGEAVAMGMAQAARLSEFRGYADRADTDRVLSLLKALDLPVELPAFSRDEYLAVMQRDKKIRDGGINFVFNKGIGDSIIERVTDWDFLLQNVA